MTYRPLFSNLGSGLQSVFGSSKQTTSSEKPWFKRNASKSSNSKTRLNAPSPDAWSSLERNLPDLEFAVYRDLNTQATKSKVNLVNVSAMPSAPDPSSPQPASSQPASPQERGHMVGMFRIEL